MTTPPRPARQPPLCTPDGRYLVVRGRLWRRSNPALDEPERVRLVAELQAARRDIARALRAQDADAERVARARVHSAKLALGERGPVWWGDGVPDENRKLAANSSYAAWYAAADGLAAHTSDPTRDEPAAAGRGRPPRRP